MPRSPASKPSRSCPSCPSRPPRPTASPPPGLGVDGPSPSASASAFVLGFALALSVGAGVLYAWGQQYDGRVLPGVLVGSTDLGGLTREQAEAAIANAYGSFGTGEIALTGPDGEITTISYADVGRGPDSSALVDAALAAGRQGEPLRT